jgi:Ser/Thr protein kinase RdoA (MazF antagonist)
MGDAISEPERNSEKEDAHLLSGPVAARKPAAGNGGEEEDEEEPEEADTDVVLDLLARQQIPRRITHNDTKINNVMIDAESDAAVCVIDLDTVMPGASLYDFGDLVRSATSPAAEDERDLSKVVMQMPMFEALIDGYLDAANEFLNDAEAEHLAFSGKLLTLECGIRFLTDYLQGDVYFKTKRPGHNIDRCRSQFAMVKAVEENLDRMEEMVQAAAGNARIVAAA